MQDDSYGNNIEIVWNIFLNHPVCNIIFMRYFINFNKNVTAVCG